MALRNTPRGEQAAEEAEYSVAMMQRVFGEAMGITLSDEQTPAISALISAVLDKASETADRLKPIRFRKRPFVQLNEPSFVAGDEEKERDKSSFPSGHTNLGWTEALMLAEVAPECQDEILRRGYQYGYNRLIVGYHWFTDIEATRQLASALVARLHADPQFLAMIAAARAEFVEKSGAVESVAPVAAAPQSSTRTYLLDGTPAPDRTRGIVIQDHRKTVRK
jgi:acid phosphatase (class A)